MIWSNQNNKEKYINKREREKNSKKMGEELARGLQALTRATQLDAQLRYGEAVQAYRDGIALLYLAYGGTHRFTPYLSINPTFS
jgi:hypothetical protein